MPALERSKLALIAASSPRAPTGRGPAWRSDARFAASPTQKQTVG
jgi:hypothetical protein